MKTFLSRWSANALVMGLLAVPSFGCVADPYGYGGGPAYGVDYYGTSTQPYYGTYNQSYYGTYSQPYYGTSGQRYYGTNTVNSGGWGTGYAVAPYRAPVYQAAPTAPRPQPPVYRPAPATHPVPSIPSHSRSGDGNRHDNDTHT